MPDGFQGADLHRPVGRGDAGQDADDGGKGQGRRDEPGRNDGDDGGTGVHAVSYTHLDVYKRQAETDVFDAAVELAVRAAQKLLNLPVTGQVGPEDWQTFADAAAARYTVTPSAAAPEPAGVWPGAALAAGSAGPAVLQVQQVSLIHI